MRTEPGKIESTRESESLKSVLLDAITHDFRTPLTSIKASVTGLLDDLEFDREQRRELLTIINEECDRINRLVGEAAEIARLESGEVKLDLALHSVGELLSAALAECKSVTANREICLDVKHQDSRLLVDLSLAKRVLVHLITKADLYSSPGKPISRVLADDSGPAHGTGRICRLQGDSSPGRRADDHILEAAVRQRHRESRHLKTGKIGQSANIFCHDPGRVAGCALAARPAGPCRRP